MDVKYAIFALLIASLSFAYGVGHDSKQDNSPKAKALKVLEYKCNVCHQIRNPGKVFTWDNMDRFAPKIYKQVFVKKRMPKGKQITLTKEERDTLMQWIATQLNTNK